MVKGRVHARTKLLKVYDQGMYTPYSSGTPDHYFEGRKDELWVEYKRLPKWTRVIDPAELCTGLQKTWLNRARQNGKHAWVVVGTDTGQYMIWKTGWTVKGRGDTVYTADDVATMIHSLVGESWRRTASSDPS